MVYFKIVETVCNFMWWNRHSSSNLVDILPDESREEVDKGLTSFVEIKEEEHNKNEGKRKFKSWTGNTEIIKRTAISTKVYRYVDKSVPLFRQNSNLRQLWVKSG